MLPRRIAWAVALTAMLTMCVSYVDRSTFAALKTTVCTALDISNTGYGVLNAMFSVAYLVTTPLAGWWLDRIGARRGLVASVLAWSAVAALHALVPGLVTLLVLRTALGVAEGPGFPGAAQTVQRVLPAIDHPRGFGLLFMGSSLGAMLAPQLAGWLFARGGWRFAFLGSAIIGLLWVPLWIALTSRPDARARLDVAPGPSAAHPPVGQLIAHPIMARALIGIFASAPVIGFVFTWQAALIGDLGVQQADVGHYLWLPPLCLGLGELAFGDLASRRAPARLLLAIAAVLCATLALTPLAATPWSAVVVASIALAGGGGMYTLITSDMLARMPAELIALASGVLAGAQSLALIISSPLVGACVDHFHDYVAITIILGAWVVPGAAIWLAWQPPARFEPGSR
ncbi:MAG TPA: MFS transporter [Kofleriaceae bacterium]|nr:MFS transporter [Kofleriaceae bacterium]